VLLRVLIPLQELRRVLPQQLLLPLLAMVLCLA
jgi:hypothetical protein